MFGHHGHHGHHGHNDNQKSNSSNQGFNNNLNVQVTITTTTNNVPTFKCEINTAGIAKDMVNAFQKQQGERTSKEFIKFKNKFQEAPRIVVGLSSIDIEKNFNKRLTVSAADITTQGFTLVIKTWSDTIVHNANVNWIAMGM